MIFPLMEKLKDKALSFSSGIRNRMFFYSWGGGGLSVGSDFFRASGLLSARGEGVVIFGYLRGGSRVPRIYCIVRSWGGVAPVPGRGPFAVCFAALLSWDGGWVCGGEGVASADRWGI